MDNFDNNPNEAAQQRRTERCKACIVFFTLFFFYIVLAIIHSPQTITERTADTAPDSETINWPTQNITSNHTEDQNKSTNASKYEIIDINNPKNKALEQLTRTMLVGDWNLYSQNTTAEDNSTFNQSYKFSFGAGTIKIRLFHPIVYISSEDVSQLRKTERLMPGADFQLVDGEYFDDDVLRLTLENGQYDTENMFYTATQRTNITQFHDLGFQKQQVCSLKLTMNLSEQINFTDIKHIGLNSNASIPMELRSDDCGIYLKSHLQSDNNQTEFQAIIYSLFATLLAVIQLGSASKLIHINTETPNEAAKYSLLTLGFIITWDLYVCLIHLYLALYMENLFHFFIMPTFWYFVLFSIFDFKLFASVWRSRHWDSFASQDQIRRAIGKLYIKLYSAMILVLFLMYYFVTSNIFLLLSTLYLVPQIVHNMIRGGRINFDCAYLFGFIGSRCLLPIYFRGCPDNFLNIRPSLITCILIISFMLIQIYSVYLQSRFGSKFFVPSGLMPPRYQYLHNLPEEDDPESNDDCAVCMNPVNQEPLNNLSEENVYVQNVLRRLRASKGQIMRTPCNHKFHISCLVEWMSIKMECPTCRARLPNLE